MQWQNEINGILASLHPVEIETGIIVPAIKQIIDDFEDSLCLFDKEYESEQIKLQRELISFWKHALKKIEEESVM